MPQMTRFMVGLGLDWAFFLLIISCNLLALAASQEGCDPALDAQLEREKRWDEWKNLGKVGALVGQRVIDWLIPPPLSIFLGEALSSSANKILEVESEEYLAIKELTRIVQRQHRTSIRRFNEMELLVKELIIDDNYNKDVELYLTALHGAFMEYADSIGKSEELQKIKTDDLGEECELYKPKQSLRKLQNTLQHCFDMSAPTSNYSCLSRSCRRTAKEGRTLEGTITLRHDENLLTEKIRQKKYTENLCKLERAYRFHEYQSASLLSTIDAIMANVNELIVFSRICSAVVHKDNALKREDAFNTTAQIGAEINGKMVEWAENRFERAWSDEMRSKAKEIIEGFTQEDTIPYGDLQKLSDRIRTAMQSMVSRKYAHQVMLISHNYAKPIFNVNYCYSENFNYSFAVENMKKVSVIVSRHVYSLANCYSSYRPPGETYSDKAFANIRTLTPDNIHLPFPDREKRYNTTVFAMVDLDGDQKNCSEHTTFFARSIELYEEQCFNAAQMTYSNPRYVYRSPYSALPVEWTPFYRLPRSNTYCAWVFRFL